jgi:hypothetical protein
MNSLAVRKKISKRSIAAVAKTSGQPFESEIIDIKTNNASSKQKLIYRPESQDSN